MFGRLADFLIGPRGDRALKDRVVALYVASATYDYSYIIRDLSSRYHNFLIAVFSRNTLSHKRILSVGIYSLITSLIIWLLFLVRAFGGITNGARWTIDALPIFVPLLTINWCIDMLSFAFSKMASARIARRHDKKHILYVIFLVPALMYITLVAGQFMWDVAFRIYAVYYTYTSWDLFVSLDLRFLWRAILGDLADTLLRPWASNLHLRNVDSPSFSILTIIPLTTLYVFIGISVLLFLVRRHIRFSIMLILERVEGSRSGIFTIIASGTAVVISVIIAFAGLLK
jgi:hypothetical protein